ncbi:hypothetical protein MLD38_037727 [Melastoma candidum]|uniref:Uncharacterized protein n=1 Tax=Melastoma candidum TaxID=119954 RepID=A0ACB9LNW3_9MYRT|nr:hypothetical protein MLD38_037727 [Melastoma candidum]
MGAGSNLWRLALVVGSLLLESVPEGGVAVGITYVENAVASGGVCLDGSPPAYYFDKGFGTGINNWLLFIEGGAWCNNVTTCLERSSTPLGSSKEMVTERGFSGMLSSRQEINPDFSNWNRILVAYCDGASFTGDVDSVDPATNLHFRGARAFIAIIEDLLGKGMSDAQNAFLSGCSAGGLAAILKCDKFSSLLPSSTKVKCLGDAGFFIDSKDISGYRRIGEFYSQVVATHGSANNLPTSCTSRMNPDLCFFPQNVVQQIQTPLFILNSAYDSWQIKHILAPGEADPLGLWLNCKADIKNCSDDQLQTMQDFRLEFINAINQVGSSSTTGWFIDSCFVHCQSGRWETSIGGTAIAKAVGDWYYERSSFQVIDCPYPCNPTCGSYT